MSLPSSMRAAVYYGAHDVRIENRPVPAPAPGDVLLRVTRSGICGTDASEYDHGPGMFPVRTPHPVSGHHGPMVLGHEFIGEVVASSGDGAATLDGLRVATGAGVSCGTCAWCRAGRTNLCARYWTLGLSADGGLSQYAAVPASTCVVIPTDCDDDSAGLAQPLAVGLHAARRAQVQPGDTVVLVGAGAIGSFILCGLAGRRAERIIALDIDDSRLRAATELGATEVVNVRDIDPVEVIAERTAGDGAQVVIEATGRPGAAQRALHMTARGGRVLLVGLAPGPQPLDLAQSTLREVDMVSTVAHVCGEDLPEALQLLARGSVTSQLLDSVVPLDALSDGLDTLVAGKANGKILIDPQR